MHDETKKTIIDLFNKYEIEIKKIYSTEKILSVEIDEVINSVTLYE